MTNRLKEMRERRSMSMSELTRRSGISRATIWKLETNVNQAYTTRTMEKLAQALDVPASEIFWLGD